MIAVADILETMSHAPVNKRAVTNLGVLNEAYAYAKPSSFSRAMRIDFNGLVILLISGTASIDENGVNVHIGDFRAQMRRTFANITGLLESEAAPGTTSCAPPATCAISSATTMPSTKSAPPSTRSRSLTRFPLPRESRLFFAGLNCSSRLKQSRCSVPRSKRTRICGARTKKDSSCANCC